METTQTQPESMMQPEPQSEHKWLHKLIGEWTCEIEAMAGLDQPCEMATATESVRSLGGLWILAEGQGGMPGGGEATTLMTLGYDPQKHRYTGTWVGSMMTHLWVYDGELDVAQNRLTLNAEGPVMSAEKDAAGKLTQYRDVIEFKSDDHRTLTSHLLGDDGQWHQFMTAHYRRK